MGIRGTAEGKEIAEYTMTVAAVAKRLKVTEVRVYQLVKQKRLDWIRDGKTDAFLIDPASVARYEEQRRLWLQMHGGCGRPARRLKEILDAPDPSKSVA